MMQNKEAIVIAPLLQLVLRPDNGLVFPDMSAYIFLVFGLNTRILLLQRACMADDEKGR